MPVANGASVLALADPDTPGGSAAHRSVPAEGVPGRSGAGRWADLRTRTLSAVLLAPAALLCIWFGGPAWFVLVLAAAAGLGAEWSAMCGRGAGRLACWAGPAYLLLAAAVALSGHMQAALLVLVAGAGVVWALSRNLALTLGVPYAGLPLVALTWLRAGSEGGRADVLFLLLVVWASDIGAYAVGRWLGGPKLAPAISPGKTRSGACGGLAAAILVGAAATVLLAPPMAPAGLLGCVIAGLLGAASQAGDLLESAIKRRFGVKHSGWLIPGHGGLLDRLDGLIAAAPAAAGVALVLGRGGSLWN